MATKFLGDFRPSHRFRFYFCLVSLVMIALVFWTQSRIPDLNHKAMMGGGILLEDPLSSEARYPIGPDAGYLERVYLTTLNWIFTNKKGMTFGLLFGACFLTLLRYLPKRGFQSFVGNAALGMGIGAPLGVCVNCAAPIARGVFAGGARIETALAMMIASPTLNVIVLSMAFSLLPFYMVIIKIVLTVIFILVAIPAIARLLPEEALQVDQAEVTECIFQPALGASENETLSKAAYGFVRDYLRDLFYLIRIAVPLMLAAGILGAFMANAAPVEMLREFPVTLATIALVVAVGLFLPAPIALDIVLATSLYAAGAPAAIVMAFLFSVGTFSIYSYLIVVSSISRKAANLMVVALFAMSFASAFVAEEYQEWEFERALRALESGIIGLIAPAAHAETSLISIDEMKGDPVTVHATPHNPRSPAKDHLFERLEAWKIGIDRPIRFSMNDMVIPFTQAPGSISAADIDNDGSADVVLADAQGDVFIFWNDGTGKFAGETLNLKEVSGQPVLNAVPADVDNDGWIDLIVTTFLRGQYLLRNVNGSFPQEDVTKIPNQPKARFAITVGLADLDRDGFLDLTLGNHSALPSSVVKGEFDRNWIIFNQNGRLDGSRSIGLPGKPGETLSLLLSDLNRDRLTDLIVGNDFSEPDIFYAGDKSRIFRQIRSSDGIIPITTHTTMSVQSADLNNDGTMEIYLSQIAGRPTNFDSPLTLQPWSKHCDGILRKEDEDTCRDNLTIKGWYNVNVMDFNKSLADKCTSLPQDQQWECRSLMLRNLAFLSKDAKFCDRIPEAEWKVASICKFLLEAPHLDKELRGYAPADGKQEVIVDEDILEGEIPQYFGGNVLLSLQDGGYQNVAPEAGLEIGGWSWDVQIHDFDLDGLLDIHVLNGDWSLNALMPSNIYFSNLGEMKFEDMSEEAGLVDFSIVPGAAAADFDGDGDVDQIGATVNGPLVAYWNGAQDNNSISIELRDYKGNRYGIGALITVVTTDGSISQMQELKLSGGFMSFDEPVLHFGLGKAASVQEVAIEWPTGGSTVLTGDIASNQRLTIVRK